MPRALSKLQRSFTVLCLEKALEIDVAARCQQLLRDGRMPVVGREVEGCAPILLLNINVTASFNQLFCDGGMTFFGSGVER